LPVNVSAPDLSAGELPLPPYVYDMIRRVKAAQAPVFQPTLRKLTTRPENRVVTRNIAGSLDAGSNAYYMVDKAMEKAEDEGLPVIAIGDVNGDGAITEQDAILLARYLVGWSVTLSLSKADIDGDGEVTDWDSILLERYLAGWDVKF
jgi:hypothetical protein